MELWKDIEGYEGIYQTSNLGRVKSFKWNNIRILKFGFDSQGYKMVVLCKNNKLKTRTVHSLVWDAFGTRKRNGRKLQIDHINNNKLDNRIENLQLLTQRQNISKGMKLKRGKYPIGVCKDGNNYKARIMIKSKTKHLGTRSTPEAAAELYKKSVLKLNKRLLTQNEKIINL